MVVRMWYDLDKAISLVMITFPSIVGVIRNSSMLGASLLAVCTCGHVAKPHAGTVEHHYT